MARHAAQRVHIGWSSAQVVQMMGEPDLVLTPTEAEEEAAESAPGQRLERPVTGQLWLYRSSRWGSWWGFIALAVYIDSQGKVEYVSLWSGA